MFQQTWHDYNSIHYINPVFFLLIYALFFVAYVPEQQCANYMLLIVKWDRKYLRVLNLVNFLRLDTLFCFMFIVLIVLYFNLISSNINLKRNNLRKWLIWKKWMKKKKKKNSIAFSKPLYGIDSYCNLRLRR